MGICGSNDAGLTPEERAEKKAARDASRKIDKAIGSDHKRYEQVNKLLLLGAGESGKSTLFKQLIHLYMKNKQPADEAERKGYAPIVYNNIITSMKTLCQMSDQYGPVSGDAVRAKGVIEALKGDEEIDETLGADLQTLWSDAGIQATYAERAHYQLTDSAAYFFDRLAKVSDAAYIPDSQDMLRSRVRTTGIVEEDFHIDNNHFKIFDVGGQRNERKKWIHCFEKVTAVLFVAAISEYDQVLYEDENTNRMVEALELFEEICNSRWFRDTSMILFLNKKDLFDEKIARVSIKPCFPEYDGPDGQSEPAYQFIENEFIKRNRMKDKEVYPHPSCACDTDGIEVVFTAVKDTIIKNSLKEAGLQ